MTESFATVDGWTCSHNSVAGFAEDGQFAECQGSAGDIATRTPTSKGLG